jgi:hypothetical protein
MVMNDDAIEREIDVTLDGLAGEEERRAIKEIVRTYWTGDIDELFAAMVEAARYTPELKHRLRGFHERIKKQRPSAPSLPPGQHSPGTIVNRQEVVLTKPELPGAAAFERATDRMGGRERKFQKFQKEGAFEDWLENEEQRRDEDDGRKMVVPSWLRK